MDYIKAYELIYLCRRIEEEISKDVKNGNIRLPIHLSIGQEFVSVGLCLALSPEDVVFGTYRGHALYLSKGGDPRHLVAEVYGKKTGCCEGKGGSMHVIDVNARFLGTSGIVGTNLPNSVGFAYGVKLKKEQNIVVCVFGDGASDEGVFYESMNFAALKKLNVLFLCENNSYAIRSYQGDRQSVCRIHEKASVFGIPSKVIESSTDSVFNEVAKAKSEMLANPGPRFIEVKTCRWKEHLGPNDDFDDYRRDGVHEWICNDELQRVGSKLDATVRADIEKAVELKVADSFDFAKRSEFPSSSDLYTNIFAGG